MSWFQKIQMGMFAKVDGKYLAILRIIFGAALLKEAHRLTLSIFPFYLEPEYLLKWPFLDWIPLFPEVVLYSLVALLAISALMILMGWKSRIGAAFASAIYAYFFFLDRSYYNNHYYLILLLLVLFTFLQADRNWSIKAWLSKSSELVPAWNIAILRFQLVIVYLYGATTKFNVDWMSGRTMRTSLQSDVYLQLKQLFTDNPELLVQLLTHGGWLFDLIVPILLLHKKGRYLAIIPLVIFHTVNMFSLNIGVFPFLMLGATIIFFGDGLRGAIVQLPSIQMPIFSKEQKWTFLALCLYAAFQILFPLRHHLIEGDFNITGEGYNFSWKMKGNAVTLHRYDLFCFHKRSKAELQVPLLLHSKQYSTLSSVPISNIPFAHFVAEKVAKQHHVLKDSLEVYAFIEVSLNGKPPVYLLDTTANLLDAKYPSIKHNPVLIGSN